MRLDDEIAKSEKAHPVARLAVVTAEIESLQQVIMCIRTSGDYTYI